jgi:hypothetical protein
MGNTESDNKLPMETYDEYIIIKGRKIIIGTPPFKCYKVDMIKKSSD